MTHKDPFVLLLDIHNAASHNIEFTSGLSESQFSIDTKTQFAVLKALEIVSEASRRIRAHCPDFMTEQSFLPWDKMIGLRNVLTHEYDNVNMERIWEITQHYIPELLLGTKKLLCTKDP